MPSDLWPIHRDKIAGVWKLISYELRDSNNNVIAQPHGDSPLGRAQISPKGYLSGHVATADRMRGPLPSGKSWQQGEDAEVAHVARGLLMYCGYLELCEDAEGLFWRTRVEVANDPGAIGGVEERRIECREEKGKRFLVLRPMKEVVREDGQKVESVFTWESFE